jgi:hypothetical protein
MRRGRVNVVSTIGFLMLSMLLPLTAGAQAPVFLAEGPIQEVLPATNQMVVMGVTVTVPPGTPITTPTTNLTELAAGGNPLELLLGDPLPGRRPTPGFIGGTAIINGTVIAGVPTATDVFCEPAENVLIGVVSTSNCSNARCRGPASVLEINGTRVVPIGDPRLAAGPVTNEFGFKVDLTGADLVGSAAELEGYFTRNRFHYFLLSITGVAPANPATEVSIQRAQCRNDPDGIQLDVLGAVHTPAAGRVRILNTATGTPFGGVNSVPVGVGSDVGTYTFRLRNNLNFTDCPTSVTARFSGATITSDVDIR